MMAERYNGNADKEKLASVSMQPKGNKLFGKFKINFEFAKIWFEKYFRTCYIEDEESKEYR